MERSSGLSAFADQRRFLVAYPQALRLPGAVSQWYSSGPRDPYASGVDDGLFVSNLITSLQASYCIDPARIDVTGFSAGGSMAGYLACVLADRIAAFAPVEGVFFQIPGGCRPAHPASILAVHASTDPVAPYAGAPARGSPEYYAPAVPIWLQDWAARDGCLAPPRLTSVAAEVSTEIWAHCPGAASVTGYWLANGRHTWFHTIGGAAGDRAILAFFAAHPLHALRVPWSPKATTATPPLPAAATAVRSVQQVKLPTPGAEPVGIAAARDGSIWFTEFHADKIGRISPDGSITEFRVPTPGAEPDQIAAGPDGTMWFTEDNTAKIGRVGTTGQITEFKLPAGSLGGQGIVTGAHGLVWVTDLAGFLDRVSASGQVRRVALPGSVGAPFAIAAAADGSIWFSEFRGYYEFSRVLAHFPAGSVVPGAPAVTLANAYSDIDAVAAGPGRTLWFTIFGSNQIGELTAGGQLRLFAEPAPFNGLNNIAQGPDGAMWFTEQAGLVGRITSGGSISEMVLPAGSHPDGITAGHGDTVWIAETGTDSVARVTLAGSASAG